MQAAYGHTKEPSILYLYMYRANSDINNQRCTYMYVYGFSINQQEFIFIIQLLLQYNLLSYNEARNKREQVNTL